MNILEDIAKSCWIRFCFISSKIFNCKLHFLHERTLHSIIVVIFLGLTMHFQVQKWTFSVWVNVTFLIYSISIVMSESEVMERSACVLLCCEETGTKQWIFCNTLQKVVKSVFVSYLPRYSIVSFISFMIW